MTGLPEHSAFRGLGLTEPLLDAVADRGYSEPTAIQVDAIPKALDGADMSQRQDYRKLGPCTQLYRCADGRWLITAATRRGSRWTARMGALIYRHGGHFYNFEGLRNFKGKFDPDWQARFLVATPRANVLLIAADAAALNGGGLRGVVARKPAAKR